MDWWWCSRQLALNSEVGSNNLLLSRTTPTSVSHCPHTAPSIARPRHSSFVPPSPLSQRRRRALGGSSAALPPHQSRPRRLLRHTAATSVVNSGASSAVLLPPPSSEGREENLRSEGEGREERIGGGNGNLSRLAVDFHHPCHPPACTQPLGLNMTVHEQMGKQ
uniref:Uncharacterized protein n=1 Tax=Oryza nivara TaxID=4536 RepID=A0A0E0ISP0_ORYNI